MAVPDVIPIVSSSVTLAVGPARTGPLAGGDAASSAPVAWTIVVVLSVLLAAVIGAVFYRSRQARGELEQRRQFLETAERRDALNREREAQAFQQSTLINELGAEKLRAEAQLLELQVQMAKREVAARDRQGQLDDLLLQKLKLEIEAARLHINDKRRRMDDFHGDDED